MQKQLIAFGVPAATCDALAAYLYKISLITSVQEVAGLQAAHEPGQAIVVVVDLDQVGRYTDAPAKLRKIGFTGPIVGLTGIDRLSLDKEPQLIESLFLRQGGDRVVRSPYSPALVNAVIDSIVRRKYAVGVESEEIRNIAKGRIRINTTRHEAFVDGIKIELTGAEMAMLSYLASRAGQILSRRQILEVVFSDKETDQRVVDSHVKRIRRKINAAAQSALDAITTIYGAGYKLLP